MTWFSNDKDDNDAGGTVKEVEVEMVPEVKLTPAEKRVREILGDGNILFSSDPRLDCGTIEGDKSLSLFNGGSAMPQDFRDVVNLVSIDPTEYVQKWASIIEGYDWYNSEFKTLAGDAFVGLMGAFRSGLKSQVPKQVSCLTRTFVRDILQKWGLNANEIRFYRGHSSWRHNWSDLAITRSGLEGFAKNQNLADYDEYLISQPGNTKQRLIKHSISDSGVRISGRAFLAIEALKRFPVEIVDDLWVAELREVNVVDPLLIVEIGGYSYSLCEWDE